MEFPRSAGGRAASSEAAGPFESDAGIVPPDRVRTLSDALRSFSRTELVRLLELRADLCYPIPTNLLDLAARATTPTSVARAVESLNAFVRLVLEATAALPAPTSVEHIVALIRSPAGGAEVTDAVAELRARALLWGTGNELQLVRAALEIFEPYPGGLAPPSPRPLTDVEIAARLAECGEDVRPVLDRLAWSPTGIVRNAERSVDPDHARTPVERLLARRLLRPLDTDTVLLPREVALHIREGRFSAQPVSPSPPQPAGEQRDLRRVDSAAAGAAFSILHDLEVAVHALETLPHRLLRGGGLATRDVSTLARRLHNSPAYAGFVLEVASAAGLVGPGRDALLPTAGYDHWSARDAAVRWRMLADAWLTLGRLPSRSNDPGAHVLGPEADFRGAVDLRSALLTAALRSGPGFAPEPDGLAAALSWERPGAERAAAQDVTTLVEWVWQEATWLGVAALGALSSFAPPLLRPGAPLPAELVSLFPTPVEQVIIQADLTAVAPGPLPPSLGRDLRLLAEQESAGGGGVYRFSPESMGRAFGAGWSASEIHAWLEQHSATGIPQPLRYLVDDIARRFGTIRVGPAASFLRADDPAQVAGLLAHPAAGELGLREIGPGVIVAAAEAEDVVQLLQRLGHNPAVEDDQGDLLERPPAQRAPNPLTGRPVRATSAEAAADRLARVDPGRPDAGPPAVEHTLDLLRAALSTGSPVLLTYVESDGSPGLVSLTPVELRDGLVRGVEVNSGHVRRVAVSRIAAVESTMPSGPFQSGPASAGRPSARPDYQRSPIE